MERDDMTREEAMDVIDNFERDLKESIMTGDLDECEELLSLHFGLEPDYLIDFLL